MRRLFLFLKAHQHGLFDEQVTVSGHATKKGTYVQPYQAKRKKRLKDVVDGDMFDEAPQWDFASIKDWIEEERAKKPERTTKRDIELAKKKEEIKRLAEIKHPTPKKSPAEHLDDIFKKQNKPDAGVPAFVILSKDGVALDFAFGHNLQNYAEHMRDTRSNQEIYETATVRRFSKKEWEQYRALQAAGKAPALAESTGKKPEAKTPGDMFAEPEPEKKPEAAKGEATDQKRIDMVAKRFGLTASEVSDAIKAKPEDLSERDEFYPSNKTDAPAEFKKYPIGTAQLDRYGAIENRYINFLREFDASELTTAEAEDGIKQHHTYQKYVQWAKEGKEPPYIFVAQTDSGKLQSTNRRRVLAAQEAGTKIKGWFGPTNKETGLPLKYGDIIRAYQEPAKGEATEKNKYAPLASLADDFGFQRGYADNVYYKEFPSPSGKPNETHQIGIEQVTIDGKPAWKVHSSLKYTDSKGNKTAAPGETGTQHSIAGVRSFLHVIMDRLGIPKPRTKSMAAQIDDAKPKAPTPTPPEKAAKPHRFNLDEPPGMQPIITHAWNTTMGRQKGAIRPLSQMTDKEIAYGWAYSHAADAIGKHSIEPKGYKHGAHRHIIPQIRDPDNLAAIDAEMARRGLNDKYELDIGAYWKHAAKTTKSFPMLRLFAKAATIAEPADDLIREHARLVKVLRSPSHADDLKEADEQEQELKQYRKKKRMKKALLVAPLTALLKARAHG